MSRRVRSARVARGCGLGLLLGLAACGGTAGGTGGAIDAPGGGGAIDAPGSGGAIDASLREPDASSPARADGGGAPMEPATVTACGGTSIYQLPADTSAPGPWAVGARTVKIGRLTVEVWYPAAWGSDAGAPRARYDIRLALPATEQAKISDTDNPWQACDCARDLPIDAAHGPYPLVVFVHGTAGFRTQSLSQMTHWASRGFVVVAADHPGLWLADTLNFACPGNTAGTQDLAGDVDAELAAVTAATGDLAFLHGRVDTGRVAMVGHSAGGNAVTGLAGRPGVSVVIPMAASSQTTTSATLKSTLYLAGKSDMVVQFASSKSAYDGTAGKKRLVGIDKVGHLGFADLCELKNSAGKDLLTIAKDDGVCGAQFAGFLFDCNAAFLPGPVHVAIVDDVTSAVLEGVNQCSSAEDRFATLQTRHPEVVELDQAP